MAVLGHITDFHVFGASAAAAGAPALLADPRHALERAGLAAAPVTPGGQP